MAKLLIVGFLALVGLHLPACDERSPSRPTSGETVHKPQASDPASIPTEAPEPLQQIMEETGMVATSDLDPESVEMQLMQRIADRYSDPDLLLSAISVSPVTDDREGRAEVVGWFVTFYPIKREGPPGYIVADTMYQILLIDESITEVKNVKIGADIADIVAKMDVPEELKNNARFSEEVLVPVSSDRSGEKDFDPGNEAK